MLFVHLLKMCGTFLFKLAEAIAIIRAFMALMRGVRVKYS